MKVMTTIFILILVFGGVTYAIDVDPWTGKMYGGYTILFNAETYEGVVYANSKRMSVLVVAYPTSNRCFLYCEKGQFVFDYEEVTKILRIQYGAILESIVAFIRPTR